MADLESVVAGAISDAGIGEADAVDAGSEVENEPETPVEEAPEAVALEETPVEEAVEADPVKKTAEGAPAAKPVEKSQIDKDLEELGLKEPKVGERENRLPHSRVKKIAENYGKKVEARFTGEVATLKGENTKLTAVAENMRNVDHLIATDPDRYMTLLSTLHPGKFDKYLGAAKAAPAKDLAKAAVSAAGPRPQPDHVFEDKSRGYTPEQHEKLLEWVAADAKEKAKAEAIAEIEERMEKKYGPMAESFEARKALNEQIPKVKEVVADVYQTWGKELVDKHETEIVAYMDANPHLTTAQAVSHVLVPKVRADRNTMRNDLIKEGKTRTAAAAKTVPGVATAGKEDTEPKTMEDVVRASLAAARR